MKAADRFDASAREIAVKRYGHEPLAEMLGAGHSPTQALLYLVSGDNDSIRAFRNEALAAGDHAAHIVAAAALREANHMGPNQGRHRLLAAGFICDAEFRKFWH